MTNPYFLPITIDGEERRPIVERIEACMPKVGDEFLWWLDADGYVRDAGAYWGGTVEEADARRLRTGAVHPEIALKLSRLAVIEWAGAKGGFDDAAYNELAHRLCDAMGVAR